MTSKIEDKLLLRVKRAHRRFGLFAPNDRIMVCMSGGKDSYAMLELLQLLQRSLPFSISLVAVNLDQGQPGFPKEVLPTYLEGKGVEYRIVEQDTYAIVTEKLDPGDTYCSLCSRLRRGILYNTAVELGCTKIALGHHRDDVIETALMNLLYGGKLSAMPPILRSDDGRNTVIRPLIFCHEEWIEAYAAQKEFPIIPCNLCGSQPNLHRQKVKRLIAELHAENPHVKHSMMGALSNVCPTHLLDESLWELGDHVEPPPADPLAAIEGGCGIG